MTRPIALVALLTLGLTHSAACAADAKSEWKCISTQDKMRGTQTTACTIDSLNAIAFQFPYQGPNNRLSLIVRKRGPAREAIITIGRGQLTTDHGSLEIDEGYIAVKVGKSSVRNYRLQASTSGSSDVGFVENAASFLKTIGAGGSTIIEAHFYQYGRQQFEFNLPPLPKM